MTLDEAIRHAEEVADYDCYNDEQRRCADEHGQLAEWLRELKQFRETQIEIIRCGECKHMMPSGRCDEFADDNIRPSTSDYCSCAERRE